jgi:hypothetical protein
LTMRYWSIRYLINKLRCNIWRLKPLLMAFSSITKAIQYRIFKIHRSQNVTAHSLVPQARVSSTHSLASQGRVSSISNFVCSNPYHRGSCPVKNVNGGPWPDGYLLY